MAKVNASPGKIQQMAINQTSKDYGRCNKGKEIKTTITTSTDCLQTHRATVKQVSFTKD